MLTRLLAPAVLVLATFTVPALALDVKDVFVKLPASCFDAWPGEDNSAIKDPAKRKVLINSPEDKVEEVGRPMLVWKVEADTKNGFIKIDSSGDGEGAVFTMALWNCKDGTKLAGVAIEQWTNVANDTDHISFWKVDGDKLTEVTKDILPDLNLSSFYSDKRQELVKKAAKDNFRWWWHLPQKGTTIDVSAPAIELIEEYEPLANPDHAYEGRWDGKKFTWVKVKPKAIE
ncbi:hypothetical protein DES53_1184 [Roseimicrobium gellanilyticum]|uniref:Uncharacterized protein n=1 Tax=Roseimicrobium gellanilyticum TaxID=748857 RepID=A0A366H2N9_9BACT|nr:hypothetical protein [Roseimicrobium gellanilyticum]RBP36056.1 hypothetical protein DES53_1184 [Roseimicrobium gellanilyticum]